MTKTLAYEQAQLRVTLKQFYQSRDKYAYIFIDLSLFNFTLSKKFGPRTLLFVSSVCCASQSRDIGTERPPSNNLSIHFMRLIKLAWSAFELDCILALAIDEQP